MFLCEPTFVHNTHHPGGRFRSPLEAGTHGRLGLASPRDTRNQGTRRAGVWRNTWLCSQFSSFERELSHPSHPLNLVSDVEMRPARRATPRRLLFGTLAMLGFLYFLLGRGGSAVYDPALAASMRSAPPASNPPIRHSIVVPTYHERDNIRPLVTRTFAALRDRTSTEIVLVDDNSRDGTDGVVRQLKDEGYNVILIVRTDAKGLSSAVIRGFEEARGDSLVVMDADLQVSLTPTCQL